MSSSLMNLRTSSAVLNIYAPYAYVITGLEGQVVQRNPMGGNTKVPRSRLASNCYHPRDSGFPVRVRFVSGRLQNLLICKRYTVSTVWSMPIQSVNVGGAAGGSVNLVGGRSQRHRFVAHRAGHFRHFQVPRGTPGLSRVGPGV